MNAWLGRIGLLTALSPVAAPAGEPTVVGSPRVAFEATGQPGFLSFEGTSATIRVSRDGDRLHFTVPMATVDTGIALRDAHLRDTYVQVDTWPSAVLTLTEADIGWPDATQPRTRGKVAATFTVHGVSAPVTVAWEARHTERGVRVDASFDFDVVAHGIAIPSYMGITIAPAMRATVRLELSR